LRRGSRAAFPASRIKAARQRRGQTRSLQANHLSLPLRQRPDRRFLFAPLHSAVPKQERPFATAK
jgi:hypothetical protein